MSTRNCAIASIFCLLGFLCACNNEPTQTVSTPPEPSVDSVQKETTTEVAPAVQSEHVHTIEIKGMKFNPDELVIRAGDTVIWVNDDITNHCITEVGKAWTSGALTPTQSFKKVFNKSADYFCAIHMVMKGKVTVQ